MSNSQGELGIAGSDTNPRLLQSVIQASPLAIYDLDPDGCVGHIWNKAAERIFGWKREEVLGERLPIVPKAKEKQFEALMEQILEGESFSELELVRQRKDGSEIHLSISTAPLRDADDNIIGVMSVAADIEDRKEIERALRESEKRFREIFNRANDAIYFHGLDENNLPGKFVEVNRAACDMLGYTRSELLELSPKDIDAGERASELPGIMDELFTEGHVTFEMAHEARDGTHIPVEISSHLFRFEGERRVVSIARDITEQKETERRLKDSKARLESAMEAGQLAWWEMELPSGEVDFGERKAVMLGYSPDLFDHYTDFTALLHPEDHDRAMKAMQDHLEGRTEHYEVEYRILQKNGEYKWLHDIGSITEQSTAPEYTKVTGVVIDIHNRKQFEQQLDRDKAQLRGLHSLAQSLATAREKEKVYQLATAAADEILDLNYCSLGIVEDDRIVTKATCRGMPSDSTRTMSIDEGLSGKTYRTGRTYVYGDVREVEAAEPVLPEYRSCVSVPIGDIGVFQAVSDRVDAFNSNDARLVELLAGHVFQALQRIELEDKLKQEAVRDPLTNLYNRRYLTESLDKEELRSQRYDHPLAFMMIDVNGFKRVNDCYSHQMGDRVLLEVAELLRDNVRDSDIVVRYGGDEFLIMMPETDEGVEELADRLHRELDNWNEESDLLDFHLSMAIGVAHWRPNCGMSAREALKKADLNMYEDKG